MATSAPATRKNTQTDENPVKVVLTVPAALNPTASSTHKPPISTSDMKDDKYEETKASTGDPVVVVANNGSKNNKSENDGASVTDTQKKIRRAERFGMAVQLSEEEKRNSRAERFGIPGSQDLDATKKAQELKMKARAERFGMSTNEDEKKKARLARFASASSADPLEEQKKKARTLRFSGTHVNGSGKIELKTTIAGKAGGHA